MGGRALKNTFTRRYTRAEYDALVVELCKKFDNEDELVTVLPVPFYRTKESFGDVDLVVVCPPAFDLTAAVTRLFAPNELVRNGSVTSFDYRAFQVDLLRFSDSTVAEFALKYFAYNDLGNFIGRTAHRLGFKFGHNGLYYMYRDPECDVRLIGELLVTDDFDDALTFLGFDYAQHQQGFNTREDVFEYATTSEYFDPAQFNLSNRSCEARRRDRTRAMYQDMLTFLNKKYQLDGTEKTVSVNRDEHLARAFEVFPAFAVEYENAKTRFEVVKRYKANFNGDNYTQWFNLAGSALGQLMASHRTYFAAHNLTEWVGSLTPDSFRDVVVALDANGVFDYDLQKAKASSLP